MPRRRSQRCDTVGPNFGTDALLDVIAGSSTLATFVGEQTHLAWPTHYDLRRIPIRDPIPLYPHSLIWRTGNPHPMLTALRDYPHATQTNSPRTNGWTPQWARHTSS